jgi:hypothetical protein
MNEGPFAVLGLAHHLDDELRQDVDAAHPSNG